MYEPAAKSENAGNYYIGTNDGAFRTRCIPGRNPRVSDKATPTRNIHPRSGIDHRFGANPHGNQAASGHVQRIYSDARSSGVTEKMTEHMDTDYGRIFFGGPCKDDYPNIRTFHDDRNGQVIVLQSPALKSFQECEVRYGERSRFHKKWHGPHGRPISITGSIRTCALQRHLYAKDPGRFANPNTSLHPRGLAIDVFVPYRPVIRTILLAHGWQQARPDDEPWHFSFGIKA